MSTRQACIDLAIASRILAHHGVVDAFGHVSCRAPSSPDDYFLLSRNLAPALVFPNDIVRYRIGDAEAVEMALSPGTQDKELPRGFLERHIHAQLYSRFSSDQVISVVHFHAPEVVPFGLIDPHDVAAQPFLPAYHMGGPQPRPVFDIAIEFGPSTDLLIRNSTHGEALASCFDLPLETHPTSSSPHATYHPSPPRPLTLMRGHGATVQGASLPLAVYRAIYTQINARILTSLSILQGPSGNVKTFSPDECKAAEAANAGQVGRAWGVWKGEVEEQLRGSV